MATEKQIAANRRNALKSTGPRTPEGKAISAANGRLHSLFAATIPMTGESAERFTQLVGRLIASHQPTTDTEIDLVHRIAVASWRQMRLWGIETAALCREVQNQIAADPELHTKDPVVQAAAAYLALGTQTQFHNIINRNENRLDSMYYRALRELRQSKKNKSGNPI